MTPAGLEVTCVAAVAAGGVIGDGPDIPWRVPGEQAEFKRRTIGTTLLMGRTTFESIGRPLPGRTTIVLTRDAGWSAEGVQVAADLDAAVALADGIGRPVSVAGGAQVYAAALAAPGLVDAQVLTRIPLEVPGDVRYPDLDDEAWPVVETSPHPGFTVRTHWRRDRLDGLAELLGAGGGAGDATVKGPALLRGGTHARTLALRSGGRDLVARWFPVGDPSVGRERPVLERLAPLGALVPAYVADTTTPWGPLVVTTRVPGGPPPVEAEPEQLAPAMGRALAAVHALDGAGLRRVDDLEAAPASLGDVLVHGDFWSGNLLWSGPEVSGIVDWTGARHGPGELDVAWARQDLVLLGSVAAADLMLEAYEQARGARVPDVRGWDRRAATYAEPHVAGWAPNYAGIGRPELDGPTLRRRLAAFAATLG
ncbi:dihydrofolate reductase [Nocardioides zeae]|uniref:dihydrofolate reductase n=1 Tax=Nocardioides imazamoxiresistens TaxID=3231893 RepID=A0ABU3PTN5_9ACTN|nr:dihydrofolate reductase [Nocardioides zeae]MDT9592600.1 dihydrofolate reductase [Nocardioides zeae]